MLCGEPLTRYNSHLCPVRGSEPSTCCNHNSKNRNHLWSRNVKQYSSRRFGERYLTGSPFASGWARNKTKKPCFRTRARQRMPCGEDATFSAFGTVDFSFELMWHVLHEMSDSLHLYHFCGWDMLKSLLMMFYKIVEYPESLLQ
jgi:hypothetical protein